MLRWIEGFEGFGTATGVNITSLLGLKYGCGSGPYYLDTGRLQGFSIYSNSTGTDQWISVPTNTTNSTFTIGFGMKAVDTGSAGTNLLYFYNGGWGLTVSWSALTGELSVRDRSGNLLSTTSGAGLTPTGGWHYIELQIAVASGTSGWVSISVDNVRLILKTGVDTSAGNSNYYYSCVNFSIQHSSRIDDIYVADGSGTLHNSFLGAQTVIGLLPAADTSVEQWQPSSGTTHFSLVNAAAVNGGATWVGGGTSGQEDLYQFATLADNVKSVVGVQVNTTCERTDGTAFSLKTPVQSGSTTSADAGQAVGGTTFGTIVRILETDPATSAEWTPAALNLAAIGIQVV